MLRERQVVCGDTGHGFGCHSERSEESLSGTICYPAEVLFF